MISGFFENSINLSDGRAFGYAEYGSQSGNPVMYFHPHPGSRISGRFMDGMAKQHGIRLITPERPGCGLSDFKPKRTFLDWPQDVLELAEHLGLESFAVLGASGGGPYAAVCANQLPQRITKAGLLASVAPMNVAGTSSGMNKSNRLMFGIAKIAPRLIPYMMTGMERGALERPDAVIKQTKQGMLKVDVDAMDEGNHWAWFIEDLQEAFKSGVQGPSWDVVMFARSWGFHLEEIQVPVYLWQGEQDTNAPPAMGQYLAQVILNCRAKMLPELGHLSVILLKAEEALKILSED